MTQEEQIEAIRQRARKNFSKGFNCAECVVEAVVNLVETGLPKDVLKLATGFGGGVGLDGDTCGAIAGAVLAGWGHPWQKRTSGRRAHRGIKNGYPGAVLQTRPVSAL